MKTTTFFTCLSLLIMSSLHCIIIVSPPPRTHYVVVQDDCYAPTTVIVNPVQSWGNVLGTALGKGIVSLIQAKEDRDLRLAQERMHREQQRFQENIERVRRDEEIKQLEDIGIKYEMACIIQKLPENKRWQAIRDCTIANTSLTQWDSFVSLLHSPLVILIGLAIAIIILVLILSKVC